MGSEEKSKTNLFFYYKCTLKFFFFGRSPLKINFEIYFFLEKGLRLFS